MLLATKDIGHRFGETQLFARLSFDLIEGDMVALTGPSGSGKSTLLGILAGWYKPTTGEVVRSTGRIVWAFQNPIGSPKRSALDHVTLPLVAKGRRRRDVEAEALDVLADFGLEHLASKSFGQLSGGEAQRLMLARAACTDGEILLIDEPTAQLDFASARTVIAVIDRISARGRGVVIATHDPALAAMCSRRIALEQFAPVLAPS